MVLRTQYSAAIADHGDVGAVAENGCGIAQCEYLTKTMRNEENRSAHRFPTPHHVEDEVRLLWRERGGD